MERRSMGLLMLIAGGVLVVQVLLVLGYLALAEGGSKRSRRMGGWLDREPPLTWLFMGIGVVFALQLIWFLSLLLFDNMATRGQFGDLFGGVNAFFTGLAFAGLVFTILLQGYHLRSQGGELRESTRLSVMATLADIYTRQIDVMERGDFRRHLWKAEAGIHTRAKEQFPKLSDEKARESFVKTARYSNYMVDVAPWIKFPELRDEEAKARESGGVKNPLFRTSYEKWLRYHRELDRLSLELEGKLKELKERQEQAPTEST